MRLNPFRRVRVEPRLAQPQPLAHGEWERLGIRDAGVIGATGGSGTRVIARMVRAGGMYIGDDLNRSEDALDFAAFSDRWVNAHVAGEHPPELVEELRALVARQHAAAHGRPWGWKEPRSVYVLDLLAAELPGLRFLHVVRDGRDMAYSSNQVQLRKHGDAVLGEDDTAEALRSIALWRRVNLRAADVGEALGERYLRLRFEDVCERPLEAARAVLGFFALDGDPERAAAEVEPPGSVGRWRARPAAEIAVLEQEAGDALRRFGYQSSAV